MNDTEITFEGIHWASAAALAERRAASREAAFQGHLEATVEYHAAIVEKGQAPWWQDTEKLARLERQGLTDIANGDDLERRRELFFRRWGRPSRTTAKPAQINAERSVSHTRIDETRPTSAVA